MNILFQVITTTGGRFNKWQGEEFIEGKGGKDCSEKISIGWGLKSTRYDYIWKGDIDEDDYPEDACDQVSWKRTD